ncbi:hypothetical protein [Hyalangium versicolor]|uniref:hypothetical protein n=1 Tax=Hyalangium versicolor TaxID=2861190 RepID=UPI001CCDC38A|nr:hypothetical protein [Hyalangium versicolor]
MAVSEERRFQALVLAPVRRVQRRLNAVAWAEAGIGPMWAAVTACVVARLLLRDIALWAAPAFLLGGGAWWGFRARYRGVSLEQAAVLADRSANAGGLLLTRLERPVGEWELSVNQYARAVKPPEVRWLRPVGALLGALVFLVVGFLLPLPAPSVRHINAAAAAKVAAVQAKAEALAKEEPLGAPMEEELRRLAEEVAEGRFDSADWEAADALDKRVSERAAEAAAELAGASEAARELEDALGAAGDAESASREREELERALMALSQGEGTPGENGAQGQREANGESGSNEQSSAAGDGGTGTSGQQASQGSQGSQGARKTAAAQAGGNLDQISDLRRSLERRQQQLQDRFDQGNSGQRMSARRQSRTERQGQGQGQGQRQGQGQGQGEQGDGQGESNGHVSRSVRQQGDGAGVGRGGDSRPLVFGDAAAMDPNRLKFQPLPEGQGGEASELWGLKAADPQHEGVTVTPSAARGPGVQGDATPGYSTGPLLPRNRELVKRYFGRE